jgi:dolichol-phosphate mannosyltransferase
VRRVLITGATGFVGANVARGMLAQGHEVHCLVRASHRPWRLGGLDAAHVHVADMLDRAALDALLSRTRPDAILHLAAYGAYASQADVALCVRTNLEASVILMDAAAAHGVERFVNTGSSSEYGFADHAPDEDEPTEPNSLYAVTKAGATAYARYLANTGRLHTTTLRLYSVYGPYEEPTRLIPTLVLAGLQGTYPPLVSPSVARDFVYVDDVVGAYTAVLGTDLPAGRVYNVGTGVQTSLAAAVEVSRSLFGIAQAPDWGTMAERKWDTNTWVANISRIRRELAWSPETSFEEGFRRTAEWIAASDERRRYYETSRAERNGS